MKTLKTFYELVGDFLMQKKQKELIEANLKSNKEYKNTRQLMNVNHTVHSMKD